MATTSGGPVHIQNFQKARYHPSIAITTTCYKTTVLNTIQQQRSRMATQIGQRASKQDDHSAEYVSNWMAEQ